MQNPGPPPVRPPAPKGPPPAPPPMRNPSVSSRPPRMSCLSNHPPVKYKDDLSWHTKLIGFLLLGMFVVLVVLGMSKTFDDMQVWAKDYDLRHCIGKYDTPQCHQDRADMKARAYINAKGEL